MRPRYILITLAVVIGGLLSTNCGFGTHAGVNPTQFAEIYPQPSSVAVNSAITLDVVGTNASTNSSWAFAGLPGNVGTLSSTTGDPIVYTAPATPPVYDNQLNPAVQGKVTLQATITGAGSATLTFAITAPSVTTGISPAIASVALGATQQFYGYAVGSTNNAITFQVNGVIGGSVADGTITSTGLYVAPANMPMSGNAVNVTVVSQSDPTRTSTALITLH